MLVNVEQLYPWAKVAQRYYWTNFQLLSSVLGSSPSLLCHLPAKLRLSKSWPTSLEFLYLIHMNVILCRKSFSSGSPMTQNFRWGSLSILSIIFCKDEFLSMLMARERRYVCLGNITSFYNINYCSQANRTKTIRISYKLLLPNLLQLLRTQWYPHSVAEGTKSFSLF